MDSSVMAVPWRSRSWRRVSFARGARSGDEGVADPEAFEVRHLAQGGEVGDGAEGEIEVAEFGEMTEAGALDFGLAEGKFAEIREGFDLVEARVFEADAV